MYHLYLFRFDKSVGVDKCYDIPSTFKIEGYKSPFPAHVDAHDFRAEGSTLNLITHALTRRSNLNKDIAHIPPWNKPGNFSELPY